ncbi:MAG: hypothetical protein ACKV1O_29770 [Saprospiraceae bacterium]
MEICVRYGFQTSLTEEEINEIIGISQLYGNVNIQKWGSRFGSLDMVTFLELTLGIISKPIWEGFFKGFFDEEYFKKQGSNLRKELLEELSNFRMYLVSLYNAFVFNKLDDCYAISMVEHIDGIVYYAVLNHKKSTETLIKRLPDAFVRAVGEISLKRIPVESPYIVQLYPDFETENWDFLFIPTISGFGNYINRYYDFTIGSIVEVNSKEDFYSKFDLEEEDMYKFIISAKSREEKMI